VAYTAINYQVQQMQGPIYNTQQQIASNTTCALSNTGASLLCHQLLLQYAAGRRRPSLAC
jgi:hypothetical protein